MSACQQPMKVSCCILREMLNGQSGLPRCGQETAVTYISRARATLVIYIIGFTSIKLMWRVHILSTNVRPVISTKQFKKRAIVCGDDSDDFCSPKVSVKRAVCIK